MPQVVGPVDHGSPIVVSVIGRTPHVFAYRLWMRHGSSDWALLGEGSTADAGPHHFTIPYTAGLQIYYWIGSAGSPSSPFECTLAFTQSSSGVPHGDIPVRGQADASGVAAAEDWANVL